MNIPPTENSSPNQVPKALSATQIVAKLGHLDGWKLHGDDLELCIEKTFFFEEYLLAVAFVNAVAYIARRNKHYPEILIQRDHCSVRFRTPGVQGISSRDFDNAIQVDDLCNASYT
jgi:4a-hydroxytetrahydrobiopterin dehydratase